MPFRRHIRSTARTLRASHPIAYTVSVGYTISPPSLRTLTTLFISFGFRVFRIYFDNFHDKTVYIVLLLTVIGNRGL